MLDDIREISAPAKVFGTVLAGVVLVQFGVVMFAFRLPYLGYDAAVDDLHAADHRAVAARDDARRST